MREERKEGREEGGRREKRREGGRGRGKREVMREKGEEAVDTKALKWNSSYVPWS